MIFGDDIKAEIISKPLKNDHCKRALLAGILRGAVELIETDEGFGFQATVSSEEIAILLGDLLSALFGYDIRELEVSRDSLNNRDKVTVSVIGEKAIEILKQLDVLVESGESFEVNRHCYGKITQKECCLSAFLSGLFLTSGRCTLPDKKSRAGYHLELSFSSSEMADDTASLLIEKGISAFSDKRKDHHIVYVKNGEGISDFLALIKAYVSAVHVTDVMVNRGMINQLNRQKNCDIANVGKQVDASLKHKIAIQTIEEKIGLDSLTTELQLVAIARKENPDETLLELSKRLGITKSCLNHRLRKIVAIASEL